MHLFCFIGFVVGFDSPFFTPAGLRSPGSFERDCTLAAIGMAIRGEPACGRDQSRHNLVSGGSGDPNHDAVMRIGSEAPKRRTQSSSRHESQGALPGFRHLEPSSASHHKRTDKAEPVGVPINILRSLCRTQNDAVWYDTLPNEPPQGDQKLARQGHDHGLSSTASVLGARSKPLRQGAGLLV